MKNGDLVKNKLTGTIGIIIDDKAIKNGQRHRMKIYYNAEEISACHLVGNKLFSYAGKICFYEYSYPEEVEKVEKCEKMSPREVAKFQKDVEDLHH